MKKLLTTLLLVTALTVVPSASAETVTCRTEQYGGSVCGVTTSSETKVEHFYETGSSSSDLYKIVGSLLIAAITATLIYKLTYRNYLLG